MSNSKTPRESRAEAEAARLQFIEAEIQISLTLVGLAHTEYALGEPKHVQRIRKKAIQGYQQALKYLTEAKAHQQDTNSLEEKLEELHEAIAQLPTD